MPTEDATGVLGLRRNWQLRLLALGIAIALWLFVASGETSERAVRAPVDYVRLPSGLVLTGGRPGSVTVHVRGRRASLERLSRDNLRVQVDLSRALPGPTAVPLGRDDVRAPRGVTVMAVTPARLDLTLEGPTDAAATSDDRGVAMDRERAR